MLSPRVLFTPPSSTPNIDHCVPSTTDLQIAGSLNIKLSALRKLSPLHWEEPKYSDISYLKLITST
jgi:hypothetical protein